MKKVLFVCMGNSCRSPMAEAIFKHMVKEKGLMEKWQADSAGILRWNIGNLPEPRARKVLEDNNIHYDHLGRLITQADFHEFDFIFGMDYWNIEDLENLKPKNSKSEILLLSEFDPNGEKIIRDPYFDKDSIGFEKCYEQCVRCIGSFLENHID